MQLPTINNLILKNLKKDEYKKYLGLLPDFKKEKTQKYISIILTLITSILLGIFALSPTLSTIASLQKQLEDSKFVEQKLQEKINNLSILQQQYSTLQNDLPIIFEAVPKSAELPLLAAQFQALINSNSIKLINFQTFSIDVSHAALSSKKFASYDFSVTVQGEYQNMLNFMDQLVSLKRIITIENVAISKKIEINSTSLQLIIKGTTYFKE